VSLTTTRACYVHRFSSPRLPGIRAHGFKIALGVNPFGTCWLRPGAPHRSLRTFRKSKGVSDLAGVVEQSGETRTGYRSRMTCAGASAVASAYRGSIGSQLTIDDGCRRGEGAEPALDEPCRELRQRHRVRLDPQPTPRLLEICERRAERRRRRRPASRTQFLRATRSGSDVSGHLDCSAPQRSGSTRSATPPPVAAHARPPSSRHTFRSRARRRQPPSSSWNAPTAGSRRVEPGAVRVGGIERSQLVPEAVLVQNPGDEKKARARSCGSKARP
jgi:hypothetical protein